MHCLGCRYTIRTSIGYTIRTTLAHAFAPHWHMHSSVPHTYCRYTIRTTLAHAFECASHLLLCLCLCLCLCNSLRQWRASRKAKKSWHEARPARGCTTLTKRRYAFCFFRAPSNHVSQLQSGLDVALPCLALPSTTVSVAFIHVHTVSVAFIHFPTQALQTRRCCLFYGRGDRG